MSAASIIATAGTADRLNRRTNYPNNRGPVAILRVAGPLPERTAKTFVAAGKPSPAVRAAAPAAELPPVRTSQVLREILTRNPNQKTFTVKQIVDAIGEDRHAASLMFFSIPAMLPVPGTSDLTGIPSSLLAGQMIAGKRTIRLPEVVLRRSVSRRSLTVAIHAILPILETAEKALKPRLRWLSDPAARRILGVFIFLMALAVALPIVGFNLPHALSIFVISLGLVEHDGLAILLGVVAGLAAVWITGIGITRLMAGGWMKNLLRKAGFKWAAKAGARWTAAFLKKLGSRWTTKFLMVWAEAFLTRERRASASRIGRKSVIAGAAALRRRQVRRAQANRAGLAVARG
jgi:hypothetical protein